MNWSRGSKLIPTYSNYVDITELSEVDNNQENKKPQLPNPLSLSVVGSIEEEGDLKFPLPIAFTPNPITYYVTIASMLFLLYKITH